MAEQLVMSDDVKHIPEMECFIVKGSDDKKIDFRIILKKLVGVASGELRRLISVYRVLII